MRVTTQSLAAIFSVTVLPDAAKLRRLLRTSGTFLLNSTTIPFGLKGARFSGAVSKPRPHIYRQSNKEGK
jgi:hypothetical protein